MNPKERALRSLWSQIEDVGCKGLCAESCGPILTTPTEDFILAERGATVDFDRDTLACSLLVDGRCSVYDDRPTVCRLWGAVPDMPCVFGCETPMTVAAGKAVMRGLFAIDGKKAL